MVSQTKRKKKPIVQKVKQLQSIKIKVFKNE